MKKKTITKARMSEAEIWWQIIVELHTALHFISLLPGKTSK